MVQKMSEKNVAYRIVFSRRSSMAIQVTKDGEVVVRLPDYASEEDGRKLILKNKEWIYKQLDRIQKRAEEKQEFHWSEGAGVLLHGKDIVLHVKESPDLKARITLESEEEITVAVPFLKAAGAADEEEVHGVMKQWYRKEARSYLEEITSFWAQCMNVSYKKIAIRDQSTRWGSCSSKGNLNFNWKLVLLPQTLADYVVVHELSHRIHMNHSRAFWNTVADVLPDYLVRRNQLKLWGEKIEGIY